MAMVYYSNTKYGPPPNQTQLLPQYEVLLIKWSKHVPMHKPVYGPTGNLKLSVVRNTRTNS